MLKELIKMAGEFDQLGLTKEANTVDAMIAKIAGHDDFDEQSDYEQSIVPERSDDEDLALEMDMDFVEVEDASDYPLITFTDGDKIVQLHEEQFMNDDDYSAFADAWTGYVQAGNESDAERDSERLQLGHPWEPASLNDSRYDD